MAPSTKHDESTKRGQKRKRPSARKPPVKQESQAVVLAKKLHHGIHEVRKAAKKAEAFELRKVVKRLKAARANGPKDHAKGDDPLEMECQWEVLKHADHEQFGNTALRTKILKDGLLSKNEDVKAVLEDKLFENLVADQEPGSSAVKVHARLLSSKILADAVHLVVDSLREVLNPSLAKRGTKAGAVEEESEEEGEEEDADEDEDKDEEDVAVHARDGKKARLIHADEESGSEAAADDAGWESGTVDGGVGDEGGGWESGSIDEDDDIAIANSSDESDEASNDDSEDNSGNDNGLATDDSGEDSDLPPAKKAKSSSKEAGAKSSVSGVSTFLPSLAVGYTRGDFDASDISDGEGAAADAPRKNRRGQRARRAIWEKKYGRNANHVKSQQQQNPRQQYQKDRPYGARDERGAHKFDPSAASRDTMAGPGRGSRDASSRGAPSRRPDSIEVGLERNARTGGGHGANGAQGEKPLHPSWEAKKKLKEKHNPGIVAAQGKKITFS